MSAVLTEELKLNLRIFFYFYIFFFVFSKIYVPSQNFQNYIITVMWYNVWAQTPYHATFAGVTVHEPGTIHKRRVI
jgi:hypothetical protein